MTPIIQELNERYLSLHRKKEDLFWETKMGLSSDPEGGQRRLDQAELELQGFMQEVEPLHKLRELRNTPVKGDDAVALDGWIRFFEAHVIEDEATRRLAAEIVELEGALQTARGGMELGYHDPLTHSFIQATSTLLSNMLRVETDEGLRRAAFDGMRSIERFVIDHGFLEIVKKRNKLAHLLGYEDYYDMKVQKTEGFSKKRLFELLGELERETRVQGERAVRVLAEEHGEAARQPWNYTFLRAGDLIKELDPYFPFSQSLSRWVRSFAAMGITFAGATLTLDLMDRKGKYENGFMHGPVPCFFKEGTWVPATINFSANAMPDKMGAGFRALETLFHEGGHAAHFSNIFMNAPCFSQEFAPTSVAYAETQSMFVDSLLHDADWQGRYAFDVKGNVLPASLMEKTIRKEQPFRAWGIRAMLTVCYVEKALYEMAESSLTAENLLSTIREIEQEMQFINGAPRPILAVPHLLSGESSAYYHGYVLAEMAVHQTRDYLLGRYGYLTENMAIGGELREGYWRPGNSVSFLDLVQRMTGSPLSPQALVRSATKDVEEALQDMRKEQENISRYPNYRGPVNLDAKIRVMHGHEVITEFEGDDLERADREFSTWIGERYLNAPV